MTHQEFQPSTPPTVTSSHDLTPETTFVFRTFIPRKVSSRFVFNVLTSDQKGPRSDGNEEVLRIAQSSSIIGASPSDCLILYTGHSLGRRFYPSAGMQSVYSVLADWASLLPQMDCIQKLL